MKTLKFLYQFLMLIFCPLTFGLAIPIAFNIFLNKWVYGEYPKSFDYNEYSNLVCNQAVTILLMAIYLLIWYVVKNFFEKRKRRCLHSFLLFQFEH